MGFDNRDKEVVVTDPDALLPATFVVAMDEEGFMVGDEMAGMLDPTVVIGGDSLVLGPATLDVSEECAMLTLGEVADTGGTCVVVKTGDRVMVFGESVDLGAEVGGFTVVEAFVTEADATVAPVGTPEIVAAIVVPSPLQEQMETSSRGRSNAERMAGSSGSSRSRARSSWRSGGCGCGPP